MGQGETSVVRQRRLRAELRRLRDVVGFTQKAVAEALGWSTSKVIRIETGAVSVSTSDLMALLHFYEVDDAARTKDLLAITRQKEESWWDEYRDVYNSQFLKYLAYEDSAIRIRQFMATVIPGLLQTEGYMRALFESYRLDKHHAQVTTDLEIEREVRVRLRRQEILKGDPCPETLVILDEAVIHRRVGGLKVMSDQLTHLKKMAEHPRIDLRIVPFTQGVHHGMRDSFTIFEFPLDDDDYVVNIENPHRDVLINNDLEASSNYVETFYELQDLAYQGEDMVKIIDQMIDTMSIAERD